ncbi:tetratricopeptide repeat protein [Glycomyces buryatensis]|uniref:tetratricopeptide repeat protein n=1 Tax=Glycomyces buryatensis TaxID=2570927 RepID=UPI003CCC58C4
MIGAEATQANISRELAAASEAAEDALLVYFGGHGELDRHGPRTRLLLAASDDQFPNLLNWRDFDWLRGHLRHGAHPAKHRILFLDTCHSGEAMNQGVLGGDGGETWDEEDRTDLSTLFTACEKFEKAEVPADPGQGRYSKFVAALLDMLGNGIDGLQGTLTPEDLYDGMKSRIGGAQTPRLLCADGAGQSPLFKNRRGSGPAHESAGPSGRSTMPLPQGDMIGRDSEVGNLVRGARQAAGGEDPFIAVVHGRGGSGKSAIVLRAATELRVDFSEWRIYLNLHTWTPGQPKRSPEQLLEDLLVEVGHTRIEPDLAGRVSRWRRWLADHQALIVLDDVADTDQVELALPPAGSRCALLITSRNALGGISADRSVEAVPLNEADGIALLRRGTDEPLDESILVRLGGLVGWSPKAVDGLSRQLAHVRPDLLVQSIERSGSPVLEAVYRDALAQLGSNALHRTAIACGVHPGPDFDAGSIAAITDSDEALIADELHRLIQALPHYRFRLHDEDAALASVLAADSYGDDLRGVRARFFVWMAGRVHAAVREIWGEDATEAFAKETPGLEFTGPGEAVKWLNDASEEMISGTLAAISAAHPVAATLAAESGRCLVLLNRLDDAETVATRLNDLPNARGALTSSLSLGRVAFSREQWTTASKCFQDALRLSRTAGDHIAQADALLRLGDVARMLEQRSDVRRHYNAALDLARATGDRIAQTAALLRLGEIARMREQWGAAEGHYNAALDLARTTGACFAQADALLGLGLAGWANPRRRYEDARMQFLEARDLYRDLGLSRFVEFCQSFIAKC